MRRIGIVMAIGIVVAVVVGLVWQAPVRSQTDAPPAGESRRAGTALPVSQVVLFSSGVGYFQREGDVEGNARIELSFLARDINDLLKSMIVQDMNGGAVGVVSFDSPEPVDHTLQSFGIDLSANPSLTEILNQARGEKVEVVTPANASQPTTTGVIVGVEAPPLPPQGSSEPNDSKPITVQPHLKLLAADGLRSIPFTQILRVRFLNPVIEGELRRALDVLARSHDAQKKAVTLNFVGQGKRSVRIGYVVESPMWKTSYRLVIDKQGKPFLQGWAVVENTTDEDWNNVNMALISGRPISFQMDMYSPLFVPRPTVEPELFASLRPPTYEAGLVAQGTPARGGAGLGGGGFGGGGGGPGGQGMPAGRMQMPARMPSPAGGVTEDKAIAPKPDVHEEVQLLLDRLREQKSAASGEDLGDYFQYIIDHKISIARQKSAMLPILSKGIEASKVSIFNANVHPKFPLLGLRLMNTTAQPLTQGPITVFDNGSYAGDARILDWQPKEERLISYAIDLGVEVATSGTTAPEQLTAVKIVKGIIHSTSKLRQVRVYTVKNRSDHDRMVLVEHPVQKDWKLATDDKTVEHARDVYRFSLSVGAGKTAVQSVNEERTLSTTIAMTDLNDQSVQLLLRGGVASPKVKAALEEAMKRRTQMAENQQQLAAVEKQLADIRQDQERLRANLKEVPATSAAYKRYLDKFDKQETEIEKLQEESKRAKETVDKQRKDYDNFLAGLNVE